MWCPLTVLLRQSREIQSRVLWLSIFVFAAFSVTVRSGVTYKGNNLAPKRRFWSHGHRGKVTRTSARPIMTATSKSKVSNGTRLLAGVDGRSATFRRFRDLVADLIREQDRDLSISEIGLIRSAAALLVRSEELQAAAVRNEDLRRRADPTDVRGTPAVAAFA